MQAHSNTHDIYSCCRLSAKDPEPTEKDRLTGLNQQVDEVKLVALGSSLGMML